MKRKMASALLLREMEYLELIKECNMVLYGDVIKILKDEKIAKVMPLIMPLIGKHRL